MKSTPVFRLSLNVLNVFLLCATLPSLCGAQSAGNTGSVRGLVSDRSGAVIGEATADLFSLGTSQQDTRTTNRVGIFVFSSQTIGTYRLRVSAPGFQEVIVEG